MSRELRSLQINYVAYITQALPEANDQAYKKEFAVIQAAFNSVAGFDGGSDTPKTYKKVLKHKNQAVWWTTMKQGFHAIETMGVWEVVLISSMPAGRKGVGNRWVLTEIDDRNLRTRTVAQGLSHVPGKNFTDSHAPVMTDLAFRLAHIIQVLMKLCTVQFDIETAFLSSDLDEEISMRILEGYVRYMLELHYKGFDPFTHVLLLQLLSK
jgi:Reverse transcriptase (RNA-dependent DNA polymerase)